MTKEYVDRETDDERDSSVYREELPIVYLDLEHDFDEPTVAAHEMLYRVATVFGNGGGVIKLTHPESEPFRLAIRREIRSLKKRGKLRCYVFGENFYAASDTVRYMCDKCPELSDDADMGKGKRNIALLCI
ncbi:MAG: hypothetical protein SOZ62_00360 [Eubacteriales bacterium]|nr:hypothetical protein [Eubacteriales bacterium]